MSSNPVVTFLGATGTVTGSRFLLEVGESRVVVDCGLYQGAKPLRLRNWEPFPVDPASVDAVLVTHAHLDHTGYLPMLVRDGFTGDILATANTAALAAIVLPDSGHLQEEDAAYANRAGFSKHRPARPLYTEDDAWTATQRFASVEWDTEVEVAPGVHATWRRAGHILGSAVITVRFTASGRTITFTGDLGRPNHPLLRAPKPVAPSHVIVSESTYGDRVHDPDSIVLDRLREAVVRTVGRGGTILIPAFAVDRTEVVLLHLTRMMRAGEIPTVPIHADSPMALNALAVYREAVERGDPEIRPDVGSTIELLDPAHFTEVREVEQSIALDVGTVPSIILSASGMATGGRVLHHLKRYLPDHRATIAIAGFQAYGTRGHSLQTGARVVKLLGKYVPVRADVVDLSGLSVHADRDEIVRWLGTAATPPEMTLLVHGEPDASTALRDRITDTLGWTAAVPRFGERVRLD
ncbi:MAG: MBL fold metallo-hydrolase RNA specificity domain-containing protein [Acidimicrobiia bacterium]